MCREIRLMLCELDMSLLWALQVLRHMQKIFSYTVVYQEEAAEGVNGCQFLDDNREF